MRDAADDTFTIAPPRPPRFVDMRRTASRAHKNGPTTLIPNTRVEDTSENREVVDFIERYRQAVEARNVPALLAMASQGARMALRGKMPLPVFQRKVTGYGYVRRIYDALASEPEGEE